MRQFIIIIFFFVTITALSVEDAWSEFKREYSRNYKSFSEEKLRYEIFKAKFLIINEHNERFEKGEESYTKGINQFSDLTNEEFKQMLGVKKPVVEYVGQFEPPHNFIPPASIDWRSKGAVLSVKSQGYCGSCWAFTAIGALEGQNAIKHNITEDLSEQELVDCSTPFNNGGCHGGYITTSFEYVKANGISTLKSYPYTGKENKCIKDKVSRTSVKVVGFKEVADSESDLQIAVASIGPVGVAINSDSIGDYKSGVFDNETCGTDVNHGLVAVGYGKENGKDYWLLKNSWGVAWGDNGYIKMSRNKNSQCGITTMASYPIIA